MVYLHTLGIDGKTHLRRKRNGVIVNWFTSLQSTCNSVSNDTLFVMLRCLVSKPFNTKRSILYWDWRLLQQTVVFWHTVKLVWRRTGMAFIVFYMVLLQSTCNYVSNDTLFVMLRCLVSKPFSTKLSILYWDWRLLQQTVVFWHTVKLVWRRTGMAFIVLHVILLQMIYNLLC